MGLFRIGIITPAHNAAPWIGEAISSVLAQTHPNWVMTVVDDGSTDDTVSVVRRFPDPRIRLICQVRAGVSAARNRGAAQVGADAVLFLDADDWLAPDALTRLAGTLGADRRAVAACGPYAFVRDECSSKRLGPPLPLGEVGSRSEPGEGWSRSTLTRPAARGDLSPRERWIQGRISSHNHIARPGRTRRTPSGDILERLLERNLFANGGHVLVRTEIMRAAGPFRPGLEYGEDWDFFVRVAMQGRFAAVPGSRPVLFVRRRTEGPCVRFGTDPTAFRPCMDAVFGSPALAARLAPELLSKLRKRREAENLWVTGLALLHAGRRSEGRARLREAFREKPSVKRAVLTLMAHLPLAWPS